MAGEVSVLSVEPWLVEHPRAALAPPRSAGFSALSRAVVGGTEVGGAADDVNSGFSALSRAVVGGTRQAPHWPNKQ